MAATYPGFASNSAAQPSSYSDDNDAAYEPTAFASYTPSAASSSTIPVPRASPLDQLVRRTSSRRMRTVAAARDREAHSQRNLGQPRILEGDSASPEPHQPAPAWSLSQSRPHPSSSTPLSSNLPSSEVVPRISVDKPSSSNTHSVAYSQYTEDDEFEYNYEEYYGTSDADGDAHHYNPILDGVLPQHAYPDDASATTRVHEHDVHTYSPKPMSGDRPMSASGPQLAQYTYSHRGRVSRLHQEAAPVESSNPTITISSGNQDLSAGPSASSPSSTPVPTSTSQAARTPRLGVPPPINTSDLSSNNHDNSPLPSPLLHNSFAFRREHVDSIISSSDYETGTDFSRTDVPQRPIRSSGAMTSNAYGVKPMISAPGDQAVGPLAIETSPEISSAWADQATSAASITSQNLDERHGNAALSSSIDVGDGRLGSLSSVRTPEEARVEREAGGLVVKATQGLLARPMAEEAGIVHGEHMGERVMVQLPEDMREGKMKVLERLAQQQHQVGRVTPQTSSPGSGLRPEHAVVNRNQAGSELYSQYSYYSYQSPLPSPRSDDFSNVKSGGSASPSNALLTPPSTSTLGPTTPEEYLQQGIQHHEANRLQESARCFERSAIEGGGCGVGMLMYGLTLRHGWGCRKNESMGFKWLMKAAEHAVGDLERVRTSGGEAEIVGGVQTELVLAIYEVGQCFFHGWGVAKDTKMGVSYYRVAARLGDGDAQNDLAFCLANGKGCKKDKKSAAKWYRAAVAQGQSDVGLAWIYKDKYH